MLPPQKPSSFRVSRRNFLRSVLIGVPAAVALGGPGRALASSLETRSLELVNTHTAESLKADYFLGGSYCEQSLFALNHLLRDFRTGDVAPIDPQLFDLLHGAAVLAGKEPRFEVISGFRSPATNAMLNERSNGVARRSLHMEGRAIDVRLPGVPLADLRDAALSLKAGGVGYYPGQQFVHIDTGRVRRW
jgi:uncharacterized protein YcbK (DUF882 family)